MKLFRRLREAEAELRESDARFARVRELSDEMEAELEAYAMMGGMGHIFLRHSQIRPEGDPVGDNYQALGFALLSYSQMHRLRSQNILDEIVQV